ncbi:hypothetical protein ACNFJN_15250 [Xenorhabdus budapestensis]|uniref:Transposase n=1 Tax=Xenorhabdus yunnanensis TaxID=3025878 RepID=A0ABT5LEM4_9GAMM|nr:hypothetical protein [Xenorhabdus yunnanensis]MDC9589547.1 hypothetical protein [Xenorhabdus yunnanensis]
MVGTFTREKLLSKLEVAILVDKKWILHGKFQLNPMCDYQLIFIFEKRIKRGT